MTVLDCVSVLVIGMTIGFLIGGFSVKHDLKLKLQKQHLQVEKLIEDLPITIKADEIQYRNSIYHGKELEKFCDPEYGLRVIETVGWRTLNWLRKQA